MNDCTNAEIRDQLPDLLHERLDAGARQAVLAHVADCVDCTDELQLLREVRQAIESRTPRVDVNWVAAALPKPPARRTVRLEPRRRVWSDWRVAAAVTLLVAGGSSVALLSRDHATTQQVAAVAPTPLPSQAAQAIDTVAAPIATPQPEPAPAQEAVASNEPTTPAPDVTTDASLSNLSESQLKTLLQDIDKLSAVPVAEPDPVSLRLKGVTAGDIS